MGMKCSSRHTFAPIDSTFCTPRIYILANGGPRDPHDRSQPTQGRPNSLLYIGLNTFQLGWWRPNSLQLERRPNSLLSTQEWSQSTRREAQLTVPPPYRCV